VNAHQNRELVLLNTSFLENRVVEHGIKQWWLADQMGVSRRTVLRWINGQVDRIRRDNLEDLARLLKCVPEDLVLRDRALAYASPQDQAEAASLVEKENLLEQLTPTSNYALAEALIRTTLSPNLPLPVLGKLYNLLAVAACRQFAHDRATDYANRALNIGQQVENSRIVVGARYNLGWVGFYAGRIADAITHFDYCLTHARFLADQREEASAWFSLGAAMGYYGEYDRGLAALQRSVDLLTPLDHSIDLSMSLYVLGAFQVKANQLHEAWNCFTASLTQAERTGYNSGKEKARAGLALILAHRGNLAEAQKLYSSSYEAMQRENFIHPLLLHYGAEIARLAGDPERALSLLEEALVQASKFRPELGAVHQALSEIYEELDNFTDAARHRSLAEEQRRLLGDMPPVSPAVTYAESRDAVSSASPEPKRTTKRGKR
jgi:tetratricopeptide (TPR) repeat protein